MQRQTAEANLIVASSYNAVVKWSLMNSLCISSSGGTAYTSDLKSDAEKASEFKSREEHLRSTVSVN